MERILVGRAADTYVLASSEKLAKRGVVCFVWSDAGPEDVEIVDHH